MKQSYPHIIRSGSTVTIEARTMAEADAAAERELGPGFTVTSVRRLRKGGLGGFFALELVELVATTEQAPPPGSAPDMASAEDLIRSLQRHEGDFAARLLDRMGDVDPDAITMQELFSSARAAGLPTDGLWEEALGVAPRSAGDTRAQLADVLDAPSFTGTAAPTTNELPPVADAIGPDPMATDGPPLLRRRLRPAEPAGPLAEMPPPPLRFDEEAGSWTVADDLADHPAFVESTVAPPFPVSEPPADAVAPAAPVAPVVPAPATATVPPPPPPTPLPPPPTGPAGWDAPVAAPVATPAPTVLPPAAVPTAPAVAPAAAPAAEAPATPTTAPVASVTAAVDSTVPAEVVPEPIPPTAVTGPTLAEMGWRIDVDTPEPVVGPVDLGPAVPVAAAPFGAVAIAALDALPEVSGPVVNARPDGPEPTAATRDGAAVVVAQPGAVLPARATRPAAEVDLGLPAVHVSVPADADRPTSGDAAWTLAGEDPAPTDPIPADPIPVDALTGTATPDDGRAAEVAVASEDRAPGPVDDLPLSFGAERPSVFRPMGLESLRAPRRAGLPWRSRSARSADDALPGTVPAFAPPPVRTPIGAADRDEPVLAATVDEARFGPDDATIADGSPEPATAESAVSPWAPVHDVTTVDVTTVDATIADLVLDLDVDLVAAAVETPFVDAAPAVEAAVPTIGDPVAGHPATTEPLGAGAPPADTVLEAALDIVVDTAPDAPVAAPPAPVVTPEPAGVVAPDVVAPPAAAEPPARPAPLTLGSLVPDVPAAPVDAPTGGSGWSSHALFALGLPDRLVHTAAALAPRDDAEWTAALLLALRPLFGPLPEGPMLLAGPLVDVMADELGAELVEPGATSTAPLIALATDDPGEVAATLAGRSLHLVVGGMWHELARLRPAVVSTAGPRFLLPAVTVAHAWGAPLGVMAGVTTVRLDAVKVAMEIRATLGLDLDDGPGAGRRLFTNP